MGDMEEKPEPSLRKEKKERYNNHNNKHDSSPLLLFPNEEDDDEDDDDEEATNIIPVAGKSPGSDHPVFATIPSPHLPPTCLPK